MLGNRTTGGGRRRKKDQNGVESQKIAYATPLNV
jgi:hypothetical protein